MAMVGQLVTGARDQDPYLTERYTRATREVMPYAQDEARRRGESTVGVSDLLAALCVAEGTRAERIGKLKDNAFYLRWLAGLPALPSPTQPDAVETNGAGIFRLDEEARRALLFTVLEADRDREYWIDSDHVLRGLLRFPNKADFSLLKIEVSLASARAASRKDREEFLPEETPNIKVVKYLIRKHLTLWLPPVLGLACYLYILIQGLSPLPR